MRTVIAGLAVTVATFLIGCQTAGQQSFVNANPVSGQLIGYEPVRDAEGNPVFGADGELLTTPIYSDVANLVLELENGASEFLIWDNYQKRVIVGSTKDESLGEAKTSFTFDELGTMLSADIELRDKAAIASTPTTAAYQGLAEVEENRVELLKAIAEAAARSAELLSPTP